MNDNELQQSIENQQIKLKNTIQTIYKNLPKSCYWDQRFEKNYIVDLTRKHLKKRGYITQWHDLKLYELAFNTIIFLNWTLPKYRAIRDKLNVNDNEIAKIFNYKNANSLQNTGGNHKKLKEIVEYTELIFSKISV